MRWFIALLLVANVAMFIWLQRDSAPAPGTAILPPPGIGQLQLLDELAVAPPDEQTARRAPAGTALPAETEPTLPERTTAPTPPGPMLAQDPTEPAGDAEPVDAAASERTRVLPAAEREAASPAASAPVTPVPAPPPSAVVQATVAPTPPPVPEPDGTATRQDEDVATAMPSASGDEQPEDRPAPMCVRIGPLSDVAAESLLGDLPAPLEWVADEREAVAEPVGYYVMIPELPSLAAGLRKLDELTAAGFEDTWLFRGGEFRHAISLGLFNREVNAARHAQTMADRGFAAEIRPKMAEREARYLLLRDPTGGDIAAQLSLPPDIATAARDCP